MLEQEIIIRVFLSLDSLLHHRDKGVNPGAARTHSPPLFNTILSPPASPPIFDSADSSSSVLPSKMNGGSSKR